MGSCVWSTVRCTTMLYTAQSHGYSTGRALGRAPRYGLYAFRSQLRDRALEGLQPKSRCTYVVQSDSYLGPR